MIRAGYVIEIVGEEKIVAAALRPLKHFDLLQYLEREHAADAAADKTAVTALSVRTLIEMKPADSGDYVPGEHRVPRAADDDEQTREHQQQRPLDIIVDPSALHPS